MVTIGLPVYNAEKWLREAMESILAQTYEDWELIVTDDGSEDGSVAIVKSFLSDERIQLVVDGMHMGISYRLNQQVRMARGEWFARMDADDLMLPSRLEIQVRYIEEHPEVDVCGTGAGEWTFVHPSVMGKTAWFRENRYLSECDGAEDWELWTRTRRCSTFGFVIEPLILYRQHDFDREKYLMRRRAGRVAIRRNWRVLGLWRSVWLMADSWGKSVWAEARKLKHES